MKCLECDCLIQNNVYNYSAEYFGIPLCRDHQNWIRQLDTVKVSDAAITLYFLLKENGVPVELEKFDGFKTVDIVIDEAKVHIEVDGKHHNYNSRQALADLKRTFYSFKEGYITLRIPNSLMRNEENARETADYITDFLKLSKKRVGKKVFTKFTLTR